MSYRICFTDQGRNSYNDCINYIVNEFRNPLIANKLNMEIEKALDSLEQSPFSRPLCENAKLQSRGIRKIHLRKYNYKMFYHVDEKSVYIDAIIHDNQDYENAF